MKDLSLSTRLYIIGTLIAGATCLAIYIPRLDWQSAWLPVIILSLLASLSLLFKVEGSTNRTHYNLTFVLYGFCLILYGAPLTLLAMTVAHIVEWIWHKYRWYIQLFNLSSYIIVATGSTLVYELANPARLTFTWQGALSMLLALTFFTLFNHLMVGIIVWLARGENFEASGIFQFFSLMLDYVLLCLGAGLAVMWTANPLAIVLVLLSLYLIYTTLRVPALERQAESDSKTGLYNHKFFMTELENELRRANRFDRPLTIVMADLDLLRNINNTYGHLAGDEVLVGVAMILKDNAREYDVVSRFGGEEFAIMMPETSVEEAFPIIQSVRAAIEKGEFVVPTSVQPIRATMSFGIAGRRTGLDSKDIIHNADIALYHAKLKGRNRVLTYKDEGVEDQQFTGIPSVFSSPTFPSIENYPITSAVPLPEMAANPPAVHASQAGAAEATARAEPARPAGHPRLVNLFIALIFVIAFGLFALTVQDLRLVDWAGVLTFAVLVAAAEWASVEIYARDTAVSTSALPLIAGLFLFGPISALIMGLVIAIVALIKHGSPVSRFIFNCGNQLIAGITCILLIQLTGSPFTSWSIPIQIVASALAGLLIFLMTSFFVTAGIYLNFRAPFRQLWRDQFGWLVPYYLGMGVIAYTLIFSYREAGIMGTIVILVPLILVRTSQKQFIDRTKSAVIELKEKNATLEQHFSEIDRLNNGLLDTLAEVIDLRDPYVLGHSRQVTRYAVAIARELRLDEDQVEVIHKASLMHDLGKLGIQSELLSKPSSLTREEFEQIKLHVTVGANLLQKSKALESLISIVLHHHEHYDGMGYPDGLKAADIPLEARIVCLADSVDAMATSRPYRKAMRFEEIMAEVRRCSGTHFDPEVIKAFERIVEKKGHAWIEITEHLLPEVMAKAE